MLPWSKLAIKDKLSKKNGLLLLFLLSLKPSEKGCWTPSCFLMCAVHPTRRADAVKWFLARPSVRQRNRLSSKSDEEIVTNAFFQEVLTNYLLVGQKLGSYLPSYNLNFLVKFVCRLFFC